MGFKGGLFFVIFNEHDDELTPRYNACPTLPCAHYGLLPIADRLPIIDDQKLARRGLVRQKVYIALPYRFRS